MERILHVIGSLNYGGSQSFVLNLLKNMDTERVTFDFVIDRENELQMYDAFKQYGCKVYYLPAFTGTNIHSYKRKWKEFFKKHSEYKIVHGHVRSTASIYLKIAKKYGCYTIAHSHSTDSGKGISAIVKNILQYFIRFRADYFMACSVDAGRWLFGKKVIQSNRYMTIINGIDFEKYQYSESARSKIRKQYLINDELVIGHVGRFNKVKNHDFLVRVFNSIIQDNPQAKLLLVGPKEEEYERIRNLVVELGLEKKVIFCGAQERVEDYLSAMDIFVFPSYWEGFGIAVLEAEASGLPCLISDTIPDEIIISDTLSQCSIKESPNIWKEIIIKKQGLRNKGVYRKEYDIRYVSTWLQNFYLERISKI